MSPIIRPADIHTNFPQHHHHQHHHQQSHSDSDSQRSHTAGSSSPVAPAYSPITPKVQPALPAKHSPAAAFVPPENGGNFTFSLSVADTHRQQPPPAGQDRPMTPSAHYISLPKNQPFSADDAIDAIALRAAISTLQFQKQKAQNDLKMLAGIRQRALDNPNHFKEELAAGKLSEQRPKIGDLRAILDEPEDGDDEDEVVLAAAQEDDRKDSVNDEKSQSPGLPTQIPDSQPSQPVSQAQTPEKMDVDSANPFPRIPGPQTVVRMPHVNWDKYGIVGAPLENMHSQQQRWPGSTGYGQDRGREYTVAAPYSPFLDNLDGQQRFDDGLRKDFAGLSSTPSGTVSEHPMETRSRN